MLAWPSAMCDSDVVNSGLMDEVKPPSLHFSEVEVSQRVKDIMLRQPLNPFVQLDWTIQPREWFSDQRAKLGLMPVERVL